MEVWKPLRGYEGIYEISSYRRIKSLPKKVLFKDKNGEIAYRQTVERIRGPFSDDRQQIGLSKNGVKKNVWFNTIYYKHFNKWV